MKHSTAIIVHVLTFFIYGNITRSQTTPLVPAWALGHIVWEDSINTEQGAQRLIEEYANHDICVDGIIIDSPWSRTYNDFEWDRQRYPHAEKMISTFKENGIKTILWMTGCVNTTGKDTPDQKTSTYDYVVTKKYGINDSKPSKWWKGEGVHIDFTNKKAKNWWFTQLDKVFNNGVYGFKVDQGEFYFGQEVKTSKGMMTNESFRPYYYNAISEYVQNQTSASITISRPYSHQGGYHSSVNGMIIGWCGDFSGDWKGLKQQIDNIYRSAQKGYGAVGCEIGGFTGKKSTKEEFIRYTQFGCTTACMINGGENGAFSSHLAWFFDKETCDIYRYCVCFHNQLRYYMFSTLVDAHIKGGSLLKNSSIEQESHCLGNDVFTKAITSANNRIQFTLPIGEEWIDLFSGNIFHGGTQIDKQYPLHEFPLFIRRGAIIPIDSSVVGRGFETVTNNDQGTILLVIYPKGLSKTTLHIPVSYGTEYVDCNVSYDETTGKLNIDCSLNLKFKVIVKS